MYYMYVYVAWCLWRIINKMFYTNIHYMDIFLQLPLDNQNEFVYFLLIFHSSAEVGRLCKNCTQVGVALLHNNITQVKAKSSPKNYSN